MWIKKFIGLVAIIGFGLSIANAQTSTVIDLQHLPLGDYKYSNTPQVGYIWPCRTQFNGRGADRDGFWIDIANGTWDATSKLTVDGAIQWNNVFHTMAVNDNQRVITSNGLPEHTTGVYPVQTTDDAYAFDRNPNSIQNQNLSFTLPRNPVLAVSPSCMGGMAGVTITGIPIYNGFDALGRDAVAHEIQDECDGHPQREGQYHYHNLSSCMEKLGEGEGHSELVGYALDGFGIFGYRGEAGEPLTNADLDECHGHTHAIEWDGQLVNMYHYHATAEFPYTVGCFRGANVLQVRPEGNGNNPPLRPPNG